MKHSTGSRRLRAALIALLCLGAVPTVQAFDLDLGKIKWSQLQRDMRLDAPESATLQIKAFPVPGQPQTPARVVLSQYRGLFYLNAYADPKYQQRVYKSPALQLFTAQELRDCVPQHEPIPVADNWPVSNDLEPGLSLTQLSFNCRNSDWQLSSRYLLIDIRDPQQPLLAFSRRKDLSQMDFTPLQPIDAEVQEQWLQALQRFPRWFQPFSSGAGTLTINPYPPAPAADRVWDEFRQLHDQLRSAKDKGPGIARVKDFFASHDFRTLAPGESTYPGLLNDIAYWTSEAGQLQTARPWLAEVLRRDPARVPSYLNLADLDWALFEQQPLNNEHQGRAVERYRVYCGLRLQRQQTVPARVLQRLDVKAATPQACQGFWPLVSAVDAGDAAEVQRLLEQGISGEVMADDGRSALLHALDAPNLDIARQLLAHGAHTRGLYNESTLALLAMRNDLRDSPDLNQARRLKFLLDAGVAIDEQSSRGATPLLEMARSRRDIEGFTWLMQYPQNLDLRTPDEGETALWRALDGNNYAAARQLIAAGANLDLSYGRGTCHNQPIGKSLLMRVAEQTAADSKEPAVSVQDSLDMFTLLLEHGANPNVGQYCEKKGYALLLETLTRQKRQDMLQVLQRLSPPPAGKS